MLRRSLVALTLAVVVGCASDGGGGGSDVDVGAGLACPKAREYGEAILADPMGHAGEAGSIIGAAQTADDAQLRRAAESFEANPSVATFQAVLDRCVALGY